MEHFMVTEVFFRVPHVGISSGIGATLFATAMFRDSPVLLASRAT
jgi:hypothetical protein